MILTKITYISSQFTIVRKLLYVFITEYFYISLIFENIIMNINKMTRHKRTIILFSISLCLIIVSSNVFSQQIGVGGSVLYNLQTNSIAGGLRVEIPYKRISFVPQLSYYPSFNKINEYYLGSAIHLDFMETARWKLYLIGMLGYNRWINYNSNPQMNAKPNNWNSEFGIGFTTKKCIRPFIEYRYNLKWKETNVGIGIIYTFRCSGPKRHGSISCPGH